MIAARLRPHRVTAIALSLLMLAACGQWPRVPPAAADAAQQAARHDADAGDPPAAADADESRADSGTSAVASSEPPAPAAAPAPTRSPEPGIATGSESRQRQFAMLAAGSNVLVEQDAGYFIDVQEARLRQVIAGTPVHMERIGSKLLLTIPGSLSFDVDSATLREPARPVLHEIAAVLAEFDKTLITVNGHTDDRGDTAYNRTLSEQRAVAVARLLAGDGVARQRLVGIGYGEDRPVARAATDAARTANRRIEILIEPIVVARPAHGSRGLPVPRT